MGMRAHFVIVERRSWKLYYSHWAATRIPEIAFAGPQHVAAYARLLDRTKEWMTDQWCEGAILVDFNKRVLLLYGGEDIAFEAGVRRVYLRLLALMWPEWTVRWLSSGLSPILEHLGLDPQIAEPPYTLSLPTPDREKIENDPGDRGRANFITVREEDGGVRDFLSNYTPEDLLALGPDVIQATRRRPTASLPTENDDRPHRVLYIDALKKDLWVGHSCRCDKRWIGILSPIWPGWAVNLHEEGFILNVSMSGRDPKPHQMTEREALERLQEILTNARWFDPVKSLTTLRDSGAKLSNVHSSFLDNPRPELTDEERNANFAEALRRYGANRAGLQS